MEKQIFIEKASLIISFIEGALPETDCPRRKKAERKKKSKVIKHMLMLCILFFVYCCLFSSTTSRAANTLNIDGTWVDGTIEVRNNGLFDASTQVCTYTLDLQSAGKLNCTCQSMGHITFELLDEDMLIKYAEKSVYGSNASPNTEELSFNLEAGKYFLKVSGTYSWMNYEAEGGDYRVKASFEAAGNNETEPNNTFDSAMLISYDQIIRGFISENDSLDFYKITVPVNQTVSIVMNHDLSQYYFSVWDEEYIQIADESFYGKGDTDTWEKKLDAGVYYIKISKNADATGKYTLKVSSKQYISSILFNKSSVVLKKKEKYSLLSQIIPNDASNQELMWESSVSSVATVNQAGKVTAINPGVTTITAKSKDGSNAETTATVIVKPDKVFFSNLKLNDYNKRRIDISLKEQDGASGYQYRLSLNRNFKKKQDINSRYSSAYFYNLKPKKRYYAKVRAYVEYAGKKYYGTWSKVYGIKTGK